MTTSDLAPVAIDFETYYDKEVSITTLGGYGYLRHPKCEIYLVSIYDGENFYVGRPEDFDWTSISGRQFISHNRSFDKLVFERCQELGTIDTDVDYSWWHCTADLASYLRCMRNLKDASKHLLDKDVSKDVRRLMKGLYPADMKKLVMAANGKLYPTDAFLPGAIQPHDVFYHQVCDYAGHDAKLCWELWMTHGHRMPETERRLSMLTTRWGHRGLPMDRGTLERDLEVLTAAKATLKAQMPWARDLPTEEGIMSIPAMGACIRAAGVEPPKTTSEDSPVCRKWELDHPEIPYIRWMREYRKTNITVRRVEHILSRLMPNGRFPFSMLYGGAHTLRWAGGSSARRGGSGDAGFNVQNMPKEPLYFIEDDAGTHFVAKEDYDKALNCGEPGLHSVDLRARVVAPPGKKFAIGDAAQIEARITKWLARDKKTLAQIAAGMSIYEAHARKGMGWNAGILKKEDPDKYFMAKQRVLALGFGCGHVKFRNRCLELNFPISPEEAKRQVVDYRRKERDVANLWSMLDNMLKASIKDGLFEMELPSGRTLTYFDLQWKKRDRTPKAERTEATAAKGRLEVFARTEMGGRGKWFYGGLLLENCVQAIARDLLALLLLALEDAGYETLFTVHDEFTAEVDEDVRLTDVEAVCNTVQPEWTRNGLGEELVLPVEYEVHLSDHYDK